MDSRSAKPKEHPATAERSIKIARPVCRRKKRFARSLAGLAMIPHREGLLGTMSRCSARKRNGLPLYGGEHLPCCWNVV